MKNKKSLKLLFKYFKGNKGKLFLYTLLLVPVYIVGTIAAYIWGLAIEATINKDINSLLLYLFIGTVVYIICYGILKYPRDYIYNKLEFSFIKKMSTDLYGKVLKMPAKAFEDMGVGEITNRLTSDTGNIMSLIRQIIFLLCEGLIVVVLFVLSIKVSWLLTLELLIFSLIVGVITNYYLPKIRKSQENIKDDSDLYSKKITENIYGIREVKALNIKKNSINNIKNILDRVYKQQIRIEGFRNSLDTVVTIIFFVLRLAMLATAGVLVIKGEMAYALFIVFNNYIWELDEVVESLSEFGSNYTKLTVSLNRIDEILNNRNYSDEVFGNVTLKNPKGVLTFDRVHFKYSEEENEVLTGLNFVANPNSITAIVGRSGNGKSTIYNLLLRYFDSTKGKILIDGIDIKDLTEESLRNTISIVRQEPFLFNETILDNFRLVKKNITLKEVREVCKKAYIDDYIMSLPRKYNTVIGEGGVNLSGGQKQRLAIARILLLNTKIVLFDEATSALDNESQEYIKKSIFDLSKNHTVIIIAHRLSTIEDADVINVIENGKIVDKGTHKELLKKSSIYRKLYSKEMNE